MRVAALAFGFTLAATASAAQDFVVEGSCRDGQPHGNYELRDAKGAVRAVGAFNRGKRTGSFLFWSSNGARVAQLPFEEDALSGTVALWWPPSGRDPDEKPKLEAGYAHGRLTGTKRSWYPSGKMRAEARYDNGTLTGTRAYRENGKAMSDAEARALAARDFASDEALYASLLAIVGAHLPRCEPASDRLEKG
jgi:antitoxin component YwqK of YwqJK toxin-antitoxin module